MRKPLVSWEELAKCDHKERLFFSFIVGKTETKKGLSSRGA